MTSDVCPGSIVDDQWLNQLSLHPWSSSTTAQERSSHTQKLHVRKRKVNWNLVQIDRHFRVLDEHHDDAALQYTAPINCRDGDAENGLLLGQKGEDNVIAALDKTHLSTRAPI